MRWSRFVHSSAAAFPSVVEVELCGILAHAWELETAFQLLIDCCVPCDVHPNTAAQQDVFRLASWFSNPSGILRLIEMVIPEPEVTGVPEGQEKRSLSYPVWISARPLDGNSCAASPPPPPPPPCNKHGSIRL
jgi:hypothetical protein